ncbi:MAG: hypothetical protein LUQ09_02435 [Methanomassiliicoccales archaeon]|nr:hypothetical protein [Methanomassiliicoccales archaeon]
MHELVIVHPIIIKGPASSADKEERLERYVENGGPCIMYCGETYAVVACCDSWKAADELAEKLQAEGWGTVTHTHMTNATFERTFGRGNG